MSVVVVVAAFALLSLWGGQRAWTLAWALRGPPAAPGRIGGRVAGRVTVQVPLYNEPRVCVRAVDAACSLRWPSLEVQILDDSTDETSALVARAVERWQSRGVDVVHVRRAARAGFKAGALAHGLSSASGEYVAIFDADFVPAPDFLERAMPAFAHADMVQARWSHLNRGASWLTRAQAALLDAHFRVEQRGRAAAGAFFGFNGTAGIWRRSTIDDAGGWDARTLTEDLDLSLRAWLRGARFAYLDDVFVPAELPSTVAAWRVQQRRWAKGALQVARLRLGDVWRARAPLGARIDLTCKLTQNLAFAVLFVLVVALPFALLSGAHPGWLGALAALPALAALVVAGRGRGFGAALVDVALAVGLCAAMSLSAGVAAMAGLLDVGDRTFHRTPKRGAPEAPSSSGAPEARPRHRRRRREAPELPLKPGTALRVVEGALGAVHLAAATVLASTGHALTTPFLWLCGGGLVALSAAAHVEDGAGDEGEQHDDARPGGLLPGAALGDVEDRLVQER